MASLKESLPLRVAVSDQRLPTTTQADRLLEPADFGHDLGFAPRLPVPALLGQWSRLLSFQAPAAKTALDCVAGALDHHATPSDKLGIRLISPPGEGRRHYLELRRGYFAGYVSCFPHGHDLYVGW